MSDAPVRKIDRSDDEFVIFLSGELDSAMEDRLSAALTAQVDDDERAVVFDLGDVAFMDSRGVAVLAMWWTDMQARGGRLRLRHPAERVMRILSLTGLDALVDQPPGAPEHA